MDYRLLSIFGLILTILILTRWFSLTLIQTFFRHWLLAMSDHNVCHLLQKPHLGEWWWCYFDTACASLWECNESFLRCHMWQNLRLNIFNGACLNEDTNWGNGGFQRACHRVIFPWACPNEDINRGNGGFQRRACHRIFSLSLPKRSCKLGNGGFQRKACHRIFSLSLPKRRYELRKRSVSQKSLPNEIFPSQNAILRYSTSLVSGDTHVNGHCSQCTDRFSCRLFDLSFLIFYTWTISVIR